MMLHHTVYWSSMVSVSVFMVSTKCVGRECLLSISTRKDGLKNKSDLKEDFKKKKISRMNFISYASNLCLANSFYGNVPGW